LAGTLPPHSDEGRRLPGRLFEDAVALTTTARGFGDLLALLDRRLHVVAALLELTQQAFGSKLALEVFDGSLHAFAVDDDLERLALDCFAGVRQGTRKVTESAPFCNRRFARCSLFLGARRTVANPSEYEHLGGENREIERARLGPPERPHQPRGADHSKWQ